MKYIYIDGDDIGLKIENAFLSNKEHELSLISTRVKDAVDKISNSIINKYF